MAALQDWAVQMALYGFNALLLYMEDVYEVQGETFFGYMRGRGFTSYNPLSLYIVQPLTRFISY